MQLFRKFYDVAAPEAPSIATIMANSGSLNHPDIQGTIPQVSTEKKEEQQPPATTNAATASELPKAESGTPESPAPLNTAPTPEPPKKEEPVKAPSWQEVLKQQQPDIILKELGFDDDTASFLKGKKGLDKKFINLLTHWEQNGNLDRYLQEANTNYEKMSAEDVMRLQLQREYPKATPKQLDILFKKEVLESYRLTDAFTEEEANEGRELLAVKADKLRDQFKAEQENYLTPKPPEKKEDVEAEVQKVADKQLYDSFKNTFDNHPVLRELATTNSYVIGEGDEVLNFPLSNPKESVNELLNLIATHISTGQITKDYLSKIDDNYIKNRILIGEFARNPSAFINKIAEHYKTVGGKKVIEPIENASIPGSNTPAKAELPPATAAAAMAKGGRIISGGQ